MFRILMIDADTINRRLISTFAKLEGWYIETYATYEMIFNALDDSIDYDFIFLSLNIEGVNSADIIKRVRSNNLYRYIKILGISNELYSDKVKDLLDIGMDGFITKPVNLSNLKEVVVYMIEKNLFK